MRSRGLSIMKRLIDELFEQVEKDRRKIGSTKTLQKQSAAKPDHSYSGYSYPAMYGVLWYVLGYLLLF